MSAQALAPEGEPEVVVCRSVDGQRWLVQVDTVEKTRHVTVYVNDGPAVFDRDPESHGPGDGCRR